MRRSLLAVTCLCLCLSSTLVTTHAGDKQKQPATITSDWPVKFTVQQKQSAVPQQVVKVKQPFYPELNPNEQKIQAALKAPTTVEFPGVPLKQVIDEFQNQHHINFFISALPLKEDGISIEEPVNVSLHGIPLKSALKIILKPLGLAYEIDQEVIKITTQAEVNRHLKTRIYPIGDLCTSEKEFSAIENAIRIACQLKIQARKQGWSAKGLVLEGPHSAPAPYQTHPVPAMTFVPQCHALVVNETDEVHEKIVELLTQLRQVRQDQAAPVTESH